MFFEQHFKFLCATFKKCHINTATVTANEDLTPIIDKESCLIRSGIKEEICINDIVRPINNATVYRYKDILGCKYIFFMLPDTNEKILIIGPFIDQRKNNENIAEMLEKYTISVQNLRPLEEYYASVPLLKESSHLFIMLEAFYEALWGNEGYKYNEIDYNDSEHIFPIKSISPLEEEEDTLVKMQIMEKRYAFENELMNAVSNGHINKAEFILSQFSTLAFEKRIPDQIRNLKNYCIIMNTLLRKAAENGGVHPIYINSVSTDFAVRIEKTNSYSTVAALMDEMFRSYCRLVKKHSMRNYSPPVQKVIACIDTDITADLTLKTLADTQNISASYLSALFKRETGVTLTGYVNQRRIKKAMHLLGTTKLQVQTVAQHCGIDDVHYFTKLFKRETGLTPKEYRQKV